MRITNSVSMHGMCAAATLAMVCLASGCGPSGSVGDTGSGGAHDAGTGSGGSSAGSGGGLGSGGIGSGGNSGSGGVIGNGSGGNGTGGSAAGTGGAGATGGASSGGQSGTAGQAGGAGAGPTGGSSATGGRGGNTGSAGAGGSGPAAFDRATVSSIMRRVADYEINRFGTDNSNGWIRATFHTGMLAAYRALGDAKYHDYTTQWAQANKWLVSTVNTSGPRFADNQTCFQSYIELYMENPVAANAAMIASAQTVFDSMVASPKTGRSEWSWEDALYMSPPGLARLAKVTGKAAYWTLLDNMYWDTKAYLYDPANSLFWRDSNYLNMNVYWARGNGWVFGGMARVLEVLPTTDAKRADWETLFRQMATKLKAIQASDGYWRSSLTQPNAFMDPETSGTAFFCFGMAWGINNGLLDRATYLPTVTKAWNALVAAVNAQGRLGWVQIVAAKPGATNMADTNDYATGAFLLAGSEVLKL